MTVRSRTIGAALLAATVVIGACRSDTTSAPSSDPGSASTIGDTSTTAPSDDDGSIPTGDTASSSGTPPPTSPPPGAESGGRDPSTSVDVSVPATVPEDADELVLSDAFSDASTSWGETTWAVDEPGEATATVIDGVGVMETDARGTHEWVRALAPGSTHDDATIFARITPIRSSEGTVFVGLHGDGEWRDASPYLPQTGIVVEYGYSDVFEGEIVLIVLDGPDQRRIGPVLGPVLAEGESANIRFEVVGGRARVRVWGAGDDEPSGWDIEEQIAATDGGVVQIAYRDAVAQSVAWDEMTLHIWP